MADTRATRSPSPVPTSAAAVSTAPTTAWLTPERVAHAEFRSTFRGLDATEVRAFLARVASELRTIFEHEAELVAQLDKAEDRSTAAVAAPLDIHQVSELLGAETARVLETAREAAADIKARAASDAAATAEAAEAEATRLREQAERVLGERTAEAERAAAEVRSLAEVEAAQLILEAEQAADSVRERAAREADDLVARAEASRAQAEADADVTRESARSEGRRMVSEARAVRERILTDMARRRNVARQQLERVRAARERLIDAIEGVRQGVAEVQGELSGSLVDAKLAGERAARQVDVDALPSMRELEAEVEMAKDTGLVDVAAFERRHGDRAGSVDTGEFAAVTALEPDVTDQLTDLTDQLTPLVRFDDLDHVDEGDRGDLVDHDQVDQGDGASPAAADVDVDGGRLTDPVAGDTVDIGAADVVDPRVDGSDDADETSMRFGNIEVVPLRIAQPPEDDDARAQLEPEVDLVEGGAAEAEANPSDRAVPAAGSPSPESGEIDPPDTTEDTAPDGPGGDPQPPAGSPDTTVGSRRTGRRQKGGAKKTGELFARLRADDAVPVNGQANGVRNGASSVIGAPVDVADRPDAEVAADVEAAGDDDAAAAEPDADRVVLHARDSALATTIRGLNRQLKLALSDQQNELLEAGRDSTPGEGIPVGPRSAMVERYVDVSAVELAQAWMAGHRSVRPEAEVEPAAVDVAARAADLGAAVVDALRQRLDLDPVRADDPGDQAEGTDRGDLVAIERLRAAYREVRSQRLAGLVEFHVLSAYGDGQLAAAPEGAEARWISDSCGPDCLDNALAGPLPFGRSFPTGHVAPPAFPGCRCTLVRA